VHGAYDTPVLWPVARRSTFVAAAFVVCAHGNIAAHDAERTQVTIAFARDGSFVVDVSNDPGWLKLRLASFEGPFVDRVVVWVDGREVRPTSFEYIAPRRDDEPATYRLRGRVPPDAQTLRWYYGMVADPYPLTIHRADGRTIDETVAGDAWSRTIDIGGQFAAPWRVRIEQQAPIAGMVAVMIAALALRVLATKTRKHEEKPILSS